MNEQLYINFIDRLIEDRRYISEGMDPGGASIWHELFGGPGHSDPHWKAAFNAVRHGAIYAGYLSREMNDSMFDDSFGDMTERTGESAMCSAFANMCADAVLAKLGEQAAQDIARGTVPA